MSQKLVKILYFKKYHIYIPKILTSVNKEDIKQFNFEKGKARK